MEKKKQIRVRNKLNVRKYKRKNRIFSIDIRNEISKIILLLLSLLSIIVGCIIYRNSDISILNDYIKNKIDFLCANSVLTIFTSFFKYEVLLIFLAYFIGTSYLGAPLVVLIPTIKCVIIGYLSSYMYNVHQLQGVLFCLVLFYPYFAITTSVLIFGTNESIKMCRLVYDCTTQKNTANEDFVKLYFLRYLIIVAITIVCIAINSFFITLLADKIIHF